MIGIDCIASINTILITGCIGTESEGTFNSWSLLKGLVQKSEELGAMYINAEVTGFELEQQLDVLMEGVKPGTYKKINRVLFKTADNEEHAIKFAVCILAAGANSGEIAKLAKVGSGEGLLQIPLPINERYLIKSFLLFSNNIIPAYPYREKA